MKIEKSRDVDAWIAENVFGWETMEVGPDANGENASVILKPPNGVSDSFSFPPKGKIHRGYFAPQFTSEPRAALSFADEVGVSEIPTSAAHNPLEICRIAMDAFKNQNGTKERICGRSR